MDQRIRRIAFAAVLSSSIYGAVAYWQMSSEGLGSDHSNSKPVAYISWVNNEVHRRPASRLIWESVSQGDPLYPGEAIRTSHESQVSIQFPGNDRTLELDPESLIVINANNNDIALDLMDGSLLVKGDKGAANGSTLTLNSQQGNVDLSGATAVLTKSAKGFDMQVQSGQVLDSSGHSMAAEKLESLTVLTPKTDHPASLNPDNIEPVHFSWKPVANATKTKLWLGSSMKDMKPIAETADQSAGLDKKMSVGRHFFKLVAMDDADNVISESKAHRLELIARAPSRALYPIDDANLVMGKAENPIAFKWTHPQNSVHTSFEVGKDPGLKTKLIAKTFEQEDTFTYNLPAGEYFWRLSTNYEGEDHPINSKVLHFTITDKPKQALHLNFKPGLQKQYFVDKREVHFAWNIDRPQEIHYYKLNYWPATAGREPSSASVMTATTPKSELDATTTAGGKFHAQVEAYNENDVLMAKSEVTDVDLEVKPLLEAPRFLPQQGPLQSDNQGNLNLKWTTLQDAKSYRLRLLDAAGNPLKTASMTKSATSLVNLMPGEYKVDIVAVDNYGRDSQVEPARQVLVPDNSGLQAPKLKKVKVH